MNLLLLITLLASAGVPTKRPKAADRGRDLYQANCWQCHGKRGKGNGPVADSLSTPPPALAKRFKKSEYDKMVRVILDGTGDMPGYSRVMDRHDARRILVWLEKPTLKTTPKKEKTKPAKLPAAPPKKKRIVE